MSDASSNSSSSGGYDHANHRLTGFPLFPISANLTGSLAELDIRQTQLAAARSRLRILRLERARRQLELAASSPNILDVLAHLRANPPRGFARMPFNADSSEVVPQSNTARTPPMPPTARIERGPKKPVVTFVNVLPPTTYNERDELDGSQNTLAYVKVQRALLKHAETHPTDSLSPRQARQWTEAVDSAGKKEPKAVDALRLCYYMRSQGYEVYSRISNGSISLYVVNQGTYVRDAKHDVLYWKQNASTNKIEFIAPSPSRGSRRNAMPGAGSTFGNLAGMIGGLTRPAAALSAAPGLAPTHTTPPTAATATLRAAQARVQTELEREEADPNELNAAIQALETLLQDG